MICILLPVIGLLLCGWYFFSPDIYVAAWNPHDMPFYLTMRDSIAGSYSGDFWAQMGYLGIFALVALLIGVILRRPFVWLTTWFTHQVDSTKVY